jgi:hypothetical protein
MYCIFLITEKASKSKVLHIVEGEKTIYTHYSPRAYLIELLEKHAEQIICKGRVQFLSGQYGCDIKSVFNLKAVKDPNKTRRHGPLPGTKYNITEEDRARRRAQFSKERHPNKGGLSEDHRSKISATKKTQPSNHTGKKHTPEYKAHMSQVMKGNQHRTGWIPIHNPTTGEEKCIRRDDKIPEGFRYGRAIDVAERFLNKNL